MPAPEDKKIDDTFDEICAFGSTRWVAAKLGRTYDWVLRNRTKLEVDGFPQKDKITNLYHKADVEHWVNSRRTTIDCDMDEIQSEATTRLAGVNRDAF